MKKQIYTLSFIFLIIDQFIKIIIESNKVKELAIINKFFNIDYHQNTGGAFNILSNNTFFLILITIVFLFILNEYFLKDDITKLEKAGFTFLIGGVLGNLFDRIFRGYVIDYLSFIIFGYYFPIFNLADVFINIGIIIIIFDSLRREYANNSKRK